MSDDQVDRLDAAFGWLDRLAEQLADKGATNPVFDHAARFLEGLTDDERRDVVRAAFDAFEAQRRPLADPTDPRDQARDADA
jgi:hypothetical protein